MLDLPQLTGKQRQFVQILQQQSVVESLRSLCSSPRFRLQLHQGLSAQWHPGWLCAVAGAFQRSLGTHPKGANP
jgi:hypothetical protein